MLVRVIFRYAGLLLSGLLAGSSFAYVAGMAALVESRNFTNVFWCDEAPPLCGLLLVIIAGNLITLRRRWKSLEFLLIAFSLVCVLDEMAMTWMIHSWHVLSPSFDWTEIRSQWLRFMYIRSALLASGFALLLASVFFMKRTLASRRDVFAAA